jgi:peptidyl-prolyl cis-trans isomerase SurA
MPNPRLAVPRLLLALAFAALAALPAAAQVTPGTVLDEIVAVVDDGIILRSEVDALASQMARGGAVTPEAWSRALDELMDERVLAAHARLDTTLVVSEEQVTQQVNQRVQALAAELGGEEQVAVALGRPIEAVRSDLRDPVRRQILAQQMLSRRLRDLQVAPQEVRDFFEAIPAAERPTIPAIVRVAHVVLKPAPDAAAEGAARALAEALRDSILAGTTIETLAPRHSADPGSADRGGRYDGFNLRDLVPEFAAALGALEPGGLSQVFRTDFGFHVARLNTRRGDVVSFNHLLIPLDLATQDPAPLLARLNVLRDSIVTHGVGFETIARRHSEDPYSASRGGWVADPRSGDRDLRAEALGPQWTTVLDTLDVGEVSGPAPVQLLDGSPAYHFVLLQRETPPHPLSLEADYELLSEYALQEKRQRERDAWLRDLRERVFIDVRSDRYQAAATGG